jgi:hypothetical protein
MRVSAPDRDHGRVRAGHLGVAQPGTAPAGLLLANGVMALMSAYGPQAAFISELFSTRLRYSGASLGYQIAGVLGGALAPIISIALLDRYSTWVAVSLYVAAMLLITIVSVLVAPETARADLHEERPEERALAGTGV